MRQMEERLKYIESLLVYEKTAEQQAEYGQVPWQRTLFGVPDNGFLAMSSPERRLQRPLGCDIHGAVYFFSVLTSCIGIRLTVALIGRDSTVRGKTLRHGE